jgi:hypothetical protein
MPDEYRGRTRIHKLKDAIVNPELKLLVSIPKKPL